MEATTYTSNRYAKQPAKGLYLTYQLLSTLSVRLPFWVIISAVPGLRPRRDWSFRRCMLVRLMARGIAVNDAVGGIIKSPNYLAIDPGADAEWIEPDPSLILGQLASFASAANVEPHRIPGYWMHQVATDRAIQPGEKVLLTLHGGAYTSGSAYSKDPTAGIPRGIMKYTPSVRHVFSPEYRLSSLEGNPFPAAIMDTVAAYAHLLRVHKVSPEDIIVEGDSAGGNLALAFIRYLVDHREQLEPLGLTPPGALLLVSPWSDLGESRHLSNPPSYLQRTDVIILDGKNAQQRYAQIVYSGPAGVSSLDTNVYMSPASKALKKPPSFKGWPRTFISCGGTELLAEPIHILRDRMAVDLNADMKANRLTYFEVPYGVHDYPAFTFFQPEQGDTLKAISAWVDSA